MRPYFFVAVCLLLISQNSFGQKQQSYLITEKSFAGINKTTSLAELQKLFGKNNLKDDIDPGPEGGDSILVTKVFPGKTKEIVVFWAKKGYHKRVVFAECYQPKSPYFTKDSLKIGSTLKKVLEVNGHKINFSGIGWDYGGFISSYNNGKLYKSTINLQLYGKDGVSNKLMGDTQLHTDMPLVKKNLTNLYIGKISLSLSNEE